MRFLPACALGVAISFAASMRAPAAEPTALRVSDNGRTLVEADGSPVFIMADTAWSLTLRLSREEAELYLRKRKEQQFNAVTFVLFAPGRTELTGSQNNFYGHPPFEQEGDKPDPTKPRTTRGADPKDSQEYDYWDHVDYVVGLARQLGFYAIMLPTWGSGLVGSYDGKNGDDILFNVQNARSYGAWLAARYCREPHVIWMMGGDRSAVNGDKDARPVIRAMAAALKAGAPRQLISYHPRKAAPQSAEWFHQDAWLAFNSIQEWPEQQGRHITTDGARRPAKPTWIFEGRYEGYWKNNFKPGDWGEWQMRQQAYQTVFAGAFGHTYGHERVFGFGHDGVDWKTFLDAPGARSMTHLAGLMARFTPAELRERVADPALIAGDAGKAERLKSNSIVATRTADGGKAMFYSANGRPIRAQLSRLAAGKLLAEWFNPRTGGWHEPEPISQLKLSREFTPPTSGDGEDWVLLLSASQ